MSMLRFGLTAGVKLINRDNVAALKALWRTGMGLGASFGNAGQAIISNELRAVPRTSANASVTD